MEHTWETVTRHRRVRHQACRCGAWRVLHGWREHWRSTEAACSSPPVFPRGWPHHKAHGEAGFFGG
ncbi:hypothetical protein L3Q67_04740 [Saccharothrix sp. AJ9571]|nr:hypothetical protein L3Q67_04740 [Saccharothrix sp. AJ9571]